MHKQSLLEKTFESILWKSRLSTIFVVIFSAIGALGLFIMGSLEIYHAIAVLWDLEHHTKATEEILINVIGAIDLYLIGVILLLFSFGIYELFISRLDEAHSDGGDNILNITSLDELKTKMLKVIVMVLVVSLAKVVLGTTFSTPLEILYFAISILCVAAAVFFIRKHD
ncbi:MAG: YqhA family protein [Candidatus Omnitrophica bacterium]|nr:YqhA family protein [Candidatus Omnitrophota bacterium]